MFFFLFILSWVGGLPYRDGLDPRRGCGRSVVGLDGRHEFGGWDLELRLLD